MRDANVRVNERRLQELGLANHKNTTLKRRHSAGSSDASTTQKPHNNKKRKSTLGTSHGNNNNNNGMDPSVPLRRSGRKVVPPSMELEFLSLPQPKKKRPTAPPPTKKQQPKDDWNSPLLEALREQLGHLDDTSTWLAQFKEFWRPQLSNQNYRNIVRQVEKLVSGQGIDYHHWPPHVVLFRNETVDMATDFQQLYQTAVQCEAEYGRDLGNGAWLACVCAFS